MKRIFSASRTGSAPGEASIKRWIVLDVNALNRAHHAGRDSIQVAVNLGIVGGFVRSQIEQQEYTGNAQNNEGNGANGDLLSMRLHINSDALFQPRLAWFFRFALAVLFFRVPLRFFLMAVLPLFVSVLLILLPVLFR